MRTGMRGGSELVVAAAAIVVIAAATTAPLAGIQTGLASATGRVAVDTVASMAAGLAALLVLGRYWLDGLRRDLTIGTALLVLGTSNAVFSVLPSMFDPGAQASATAPVVGGLAAGAIFAGGALRARGAVPPPRRVGYGLAVLATALGSAIVLAVAVGELWSVPGVPHSSADTFGTTPNGSISALQAVTAALFLLACIGCARHARRDGDALMSFVSLGAALAAVSRVDFAISHYPASGWAASGNLLRLGFYLVLVLGAAVEIVRYWQRSADAAVLEERRRIARDLHDGLAQELAFIAAHARVVAEDAPSPTRPQLVAAAAERALDEARRAIATLTRPLDEPLDVTIAQAAEEVAGRHGARVFLRLTPGPQVQPEAREALVRITREAVTNAVRHGEAARIEVFLDQRDGLRLCVRDNGRGFDPGHVEALAGRVGLTSMRERAEALGGRLEITSQPQQGTRVEAWLPCAS